MALTFIEGNLSYISLKNTKAMFGPHPCTVMKLDEEKKYFSCKYLLNNEWKGYHDPNFDVENPTKRKLEGKFWYMNAYSLKLLQTLRWPKQILFIFETKEEARKCLNVFFPFNVPTFFYLQIRIFMGIERIHHFSLNTFFSLSLSLVLR